MATFRHGFRELVVAVAVAVTGDLDDSGGEVAVPAAVAAPYEAPGLAPGGGVDVGATIGIAELRVGRGGSAPLNADGICCCG